VRRWYRGAVLVHHTIVARAANRFPIFISFRSTPQRVVKCNTAPLPDRGAVSRTRRGRAEASTLRRLRVGRVMRREERVAVPIRSCYADSAVIAALIGDLPSRVALRDQADPL
jgi:hypothetical protein